jgi:hypothetical protein
MQMPAGRYKYAYAAIKEADMRMDLNTLREFVQIFKNELNGGQQGKAVNMGNLWRATLNLESRIVLQFEPASIKRLAAVMYFDETEDLSTYKPQHGAQKIELWEKHLADDFFLMKPIVELVGLRNISEESLKDYIQETTLLIKDLTTEMQTLSKDTSSGNGKKGS